MEQPGGNQTRIEVRQIEEDGCLVAMAIGDESVAVRVKVSRGGDDARRLRDARRRAREIALELAEELVDDPA